MTNQIGPPQIVVTNDGPYEVRGAAPALRNHLGIDSDWTTRRLCRCGASATKPFCDGAHETNGFTGEKAPD